MACCTATRCRSRGRRSPRCCGTSRRHHARIRRSSARGTGRSIRTGILPSCAATSRAKGAWRRSRVRLEEHTSELQSHSDLVCRLLLEKKKKKNKETNTKKASQKIRCE